MNNLDWRKLILEMLMVMTGVFLALLVDEWREERQIAESVAIMEERILEEVLYNQDRLREYEERISERLIQLDEWGSTLEVGKSFREQANFPGMPSISLNDAVWQRANTSNVTNYSEAEIFTHAHSLYDYNERVVNASEALLTLIFSKESWDSELTEVSLNITKSIFREARSQTRQALASYAQVIEIYSEPGL